MGWGHDGLHKRRDYWYISWRENGEPHEKSTRLKDRAAAKEYRDRFMKRLKDGQLPNDMADWPLEVAVRKYNEWRKATTARRTAQVECTLLRQVLAFFGPGKKLRTFTERDFREYQVHRSQTISRTLKRPVQPRSINYELWCLRKILEQANLWHGALSNKYRRMRQAKAACGQALTPSQAQHLVTTAMQRDSWEVAFCCMVLAYSTGCRSWEIKTLQIDAIDLAGNELTIKPHFAKNRRARTVALNAMSTWALTRLLQRARLLGATKPSHFLLPHDLSKHTKFDDPLKGRKGYDPTQHQTSWASSWRLLRAQAGFPTFRFHDLRHTYNTQGAEAGVPVDVLMAQVGYIDPAMAQHYTHISNKAKHLAAARIEAANSGLLALLENSERKMLPPEVTASQY